jgi:hypothetical protein
MEDSWRSHNFELLRLHLRKTGVKIRLKSYRLGRVDFLKLAFYVPHDDVNSPNFIRVKGSLL